MAPETRACDTRRMEKQRREARREAPDYTRLPEPVRLEDTVESKAVSAPFVPGEDQLQEIQLKQGA